MARPKAPLRRYQLHIVCGVLCQAASPKPVFIAADCEEQWGADEAGPAETQVIGSRLHVRYREFQANDSCVTLEAQLDLKSVRIYKISRKRGTVTADKCVAGKVEEATSVGHGSPARPLLILHVE